MIGKRIGQLRITDKLGQGGMGVVYLAEHITLRKHFAVKCLFPALTEDPDFSERFYREAQNQALLDHPNIVQALDFLEKDKQFFLVMEYVNGQALDKIIEEKGKLSEIEALTLFKAILSGLDFAHGKAIIHRDIKPSNVIVDGTGRPRIMDFGIAILAGEERLTSVGSNIGSPWYMSPESITQPQNIDHRSDVYSAGIVLYEMLTGQLPFDGSTEFEVQNQQVNSAVPNPRKKNPEISSRLSKIILKALEKDPDQRFAGCAEFLEWIQAYEKLRDKPPIPGWQKLLWSALTVATLTSIGIAIYINKTQVIADQSESARILVHSATDKANITCREFVELHANITFLESARLIKDRKKIMLSEQRIADHSANIREGVSSYNKFLSDMRGIDRTVVHEKFDALAEELTLEQLFDKIDILRLVKLHYQQADKLDAKSLCKSCREHHNKYESLNCQSVIEIL